MIKSIDSLRSSIDRQESQEIGVVMFKVGDEYLYDRCCGNSASDVIKFLKQRPYKIDGVVMYRINGEWHDWNEDQFCLE